MGKIEQVNHDTLGGITYLASVAVSLTDEDIVKLLRERALSVFFPDDRLGQVLIQVVNEDAASHRD